MNHANNTSSTGTSRGRKPKERGAILMVALILSAALAVSLGSYMSLATHAAKMANRSFYMDAAQNLCDTGLELALWSMNNSNNWTGAGFTQVSSNEYRMTFPSATTYYTFSAGVKGQVKVFADLTTSTEPHVIAKAIVTLVDGSQIIKESEAYFRQSSYFDNGLVASTINFSGNNVTVNSWNSDPDNNAATAAIAYSSGVAAANATVGATSVLPGALADQNGKIYGYAAAGSSSSGGGITLQNGIIGGTAFVNNSANKGQIEAGHATYDFTASFPDVSWQYGNKTINGPYTNITGSIPVTTGNVTHTADADGYYYYNVSALTIGGTNELRVKAGYKVRLQATNSVGEAVKVDGNGAIVIEGNASLDLYTAGEISIAGNGVTNGGTSVSGANQPKNFQVYGTRTAAQAAVSGYQEIDIKGNGYLSGVVYAPNADIDIAGGGSGGDVLGAIIGHTITMTGGTSFHYDESLPNNLVTGLWKLKKWRELVTDSERSPYEADLTF